MENSGVHSSESENVPRALHVPPWFWDLDIEKAHNRLETKIQVYLSLLWTPNQDNTLHHSCYVHMLIPCTQATLKINIHLSFINSNAR